MRHYYLLWILLSFNFHASAQNKVSKELEGIIKLRKLSLDENLNEKLRINYAKKALELSENLDQDTTILKSGRNLALLYDRLDRIDLWQSQNKKNLILAKQIPDTLAIAVANFNIGLAKHYYDIQYDSAYYYYSEALNHYNNIGNTDIVATIYLYIAKSLC